MKRITVVCLCLTFMLSGLCSVAHAETQTTEISFIIGSRDITIGGKTMQAEASYTENDTTLVPLRVISEAFGAEVEWIGETESVSIKLGDRSILLSIGSNICLVDGTEKPLLAAPALRGGTTMVPLRFISETFGALVQYDGETERVTVTYTITLPDPQPQGTDLQLPAFGVRLTMPEGWTQRETSANRLLLEKRYNGGTVDFFYILAAQTDCSAEEWLKQETHFLKSQYGEKYFQSKSGQAADNNGNWTTLHVSVNYPEWQTQLREQYLQLDGFGYFVRYGRLTPSPQDSAEPVEIPKLEESFAVPQPPAGAALPGSEPAWAELEQLLETLSVTGTTLDAVLSAHPDWNATRNVLNKYDGWNMDLPESFTQIILDDGISFLEQQPDGIRFVIASGKYGTIKFQNVLSYDIPLRKLSSKDLPHGEKVNFFNAFSNITCSGWRATGNLIYTEDITPLKKDAISGSIYQKSAMTIQRDTVRYHAWNYFYDTVFMAQFLMPEQTSNWLDMNRMHELLKTFQNSRKQGVLYQ